MEMIVAMIRPFKIDDVKQALTEAEGEQEGLDLHEHGGGAYPEQMMGSGGSFTSVSKAAPAAAPVPAE